MRLLAEILEQHLHQPELETIAPCAAETIVVSQPIDVAVVSTPMTSVPRRVRNQATVLAIICSTWQVMVPGRPGFFRCQFFSRLAADPAASRPSR